MRKKTDNKQLLLKILDKQIGMRFVNKKNSNYKRVFKKKSLHKIIKNF